jgi:hypothetical protein
MLQNHLHFPPNLKTVSQLLNQLCRGHYCPEGPVGMQPKPLWFRSPVKKNMYITP